MTTLHILCELNKPRLVKRLMPKEPLFIPDNKGFSPLRVAVRNKSYECAILILKYYLDDDRNFDNKKLFGTIENDIKDLLKLPS